MIISNDPTRTDARGWADGDCTSDTSTASTTGWFPWPLDYQWEVAEEEEPVKPKYKAPRPERQHNRIEQCQMCMPMKQHVKQMLGSQRWNR